MSGSVAARRAAQLLLRGLGRAAPQAEACVASALAGTRGVATLGPSSSLLARLGGGVGSGAAPAARRPPPPRPPPAAARRGLFIQTQTTPNPASLMFAPGQEVMGAAGPRNFASPREAMASPLAKRLFRVDGVAAVFLGSDFVTVTKSDDASWAVLKPDVFAAITEHYASGEPLVYDAGGGAGPAPGSADAAHAISPDDSEVVAMIKELLETRIRPAVQEDGGDVAFRSFEPGSGVVELKMMGACSGCPSSAVTLKSGIENMLMHYIPEVRAVVEAPPDEGEAEGVKAFARLEQHLSN